MFQVAIVDDEKRVCESLTQYISTFNIKYDYDFRVRSFESCEAFCKALKSGFQADLLFLDLEFPAMSGITLGQMIRRQRRDYLLQIVFISSSKEYVMDLFSISPMDFLVKPISFEALSHCLQVFLTSFRQNGGFLTFVQDNIRQELPMREILYLQSQGKKVIIHTCTLGEQAVYGKVQTLIEPYSNRFLCLSRGLYANINHILRVYVGAAEMTGGEVLTISRARQDSVRDRLVMM